MTVSLSVINLAARSWFLWNVVQKSTVPTASRPKHRWFSLHLSAEQCTSSSCILNSGASCFVERLLNSTCDRPTARTLIPWLTAFSECYRNETTTVPHANRGRGRSAAEVDEHVGWLPTEGSRSNAPGQLPPGQLPPVFGRPGQTPPPSWNAICGQKPPRSNDPPLKRFPIW